MHAGIHTQELGKLSRSHQRVGMVSRRLTRSSSAIGAAKLITQLKQFDQRKRRCHLHKGERYAGHPCPFTQRKQARAAKRLPAAMKFDNIGAVVVRRRSACNMEGPRKGERGALLQNAIACQLRILQGRCLVGELSATHGLGLLGRGQCRQYFQRCLVAKANDPPGSDGGRWPNHDALLSGPS